MTTLSQVLAHNPPDHLYRGMVRSGFTDFSPAQVLSFFGLEAALWFLRCTEADAGKALELGARALLLATENPEYRECPAVLRAASRIILRCAESVEDSGTAPTAPDAMYDWSEELMNRADGTTYRSSREAFDAAVTASLFNAEILEDF